MHSTILAVFAALLTAYALSPAVAAPPAEAGDVDAAVAAAIRPVMKQFGIPGMAVGVTLHGRHYVMDYGVASRASNRPVDRFTLFEIGSVTKTFTASLASYAALTGRLSLESETSAHVPALRGTSFDRVPLVDLATHTAGSLPLQFPDEVRSDADAVAFYKRWKPSHPPGSYRLYSNPGVMLLGLATARSLNADFAAAVRRELFAPLGMRNTFFTVPPGAWSRYAQGYASDGAPKRMAPGPLAPEAYGIHTTADDLLRFVDAGMDLTPVDATLHRALVATHTGYFRLGAMTQDLVWEQYDYPVALPEVLQGNSRHVLFDDDRVVKLDRPAPPGSDVLIDKTGSTNGFAAYVAFVPKHALGIVLLANRAYPIAARVTAAYRILTRLAKTSGDSRR